MDKYKEVEERLLSKVVVNPITMCWNWNGRRDHNNYGRINAFGQKWPTHRLSYFLYYGFISPDLVVNHMCDNKPCCNPNHLELVTHQENIDYITKIGNGRNITKTYNRTNLYCKKGHPRFGDNLKVKKKGGGKTYRECRTCWNEAKNKAYHRRTASKS